MPGKVSTLNCEMTVWMPTARLGILRAFSLWKVATAFLKFPGTLRMVSCWSSMPSRETLMMIWALGQALAMAAVFSTIALVRMPLVGMLIMCGWEML